MKPSNQTKVTTGILAGSISTVLWWLLSSGFQLEAPAAVASASTVIITALLQTWGEP